ncbi:carbohydrate ABC transporter permease [Telmatospirillum sp.]|uniref:carbohydrate ABC transporter permease n=1 Tax=Telmatospirillum sp. TaxID=2079197 RepID=UPI00284E0BAA|nr:carbohydrate ABC transporter permease [Telmatospirillum sp.]MDR3436985.1 carbohydrate ABC transporter permease [Telmatospirillum sp.]
MHANLSRRSLLALAALAACMFAIGPLLWGLSTALKPLAQIFAYPPKLFPWPVSLENFERVWTESYFPTYFLNSILVTAISVVVSLALSVHAAYGLARFHFRGKTALLMGLLATSMIPGVAILVPLYNLSVGTGLYNSLTGLVIVYSAWNVPLLVWLLKGFFESIPIELEEAALVDGCGRMRAFYLVVMPMVAPGLLAGAIMTMMFVWNDFLIGFTLTISESQRLLPVGLFAYISNVGIDWGQLTAAAIFALLPVVFAFLVMQKWLVQGLTAGAVKG